MRIGGVAAIPTETVPKQTTISGQPHMLAYINPQEAQLLQDRGGIGSLFGIPTFYNPADDMGLESSVSDQESVSAGMGATDSSGDEGTGPVDFGLNPFGGMGPNTNMGLSMTNTGYNPNLGGGSVTQTALGTSGFAPLGTGQAPDTGFSFTPSQVGRGITSLLSLVPNPVQPIAQVISKGLAAKDIANVVGGSREGVLGGLISGIENFSLKDLTADLAKRARGQ